MSAYDKSKALIFRGGTIPVDGVTPGDLAAEVAILEAADAAIAAIAADVAENNAAGLAMVAAGLSKLEEDTEAILPVAVGNDTTIPLVSIGGDAVLYQEADGVTMIPSTTTLTNIGVGKVTAGTTAPIAAIGGDAVLWHDGSGVDLAPSPAFDAKMGVGRGAAGTTAPIAAIGGDAVAWHTGDGLDFLPSSALVARLSESLNLTGDPPSVTGGEYLRRTRAKIAALRQETAGAQLRLLIMGDSWTALSHLSDGIFAVLNAAYPVVCDGFLSSNMVGASLTGGEYTASEGWVYIDGTDAEMTLGVTPDGRMLHTDATDQTATWTDLRCTRFSIYVREHGGTWRYRVDGGSWTTVTDADTGALKRVQITGLADTTHSFEIDTTGNAGTVALAGFFAARPSVSGVVISRFANGGEAALTFSEYLPAQTVVMGHEPPDLILVVLGTNDARSTESLPSVFVDYMGDLIAAARGVQSDIDVINLIGPQNADPVNRPTTAYRDALWLSRDTLKSEYLSLSEYYGTFAQADALGLWADGLHPSFTGGRMIADLLNDLLIRI